MQSISDDDGKEITTKSNKFQFYLESLKKISLQKFADESIIGRNCEISGTPACEGDSLLGYSQACTNNTQAERKNDRQLATMTKTMMKMKMIRLAPRCTYAAMLFDRGHRSMDAWYFMFSICFFSASLSMVASTLGSMVTAAPPLSQIGNGMARAPTRENQ